LRIVRAHTAAARAVLFQAAGDFDAPFGLVAFAGGKLAGLSRAEPKGGYGLEEFVVSPRLD
jgi:hypothetical protein